MRRMLYSLVGLCLFVLFVIAFNTKNEQQTPANQPIGEVGVNTSTEPSNQESSLLSNSISRDATLFNKNTETNQQKIVNKTPLKQIEKDGKSYPNRVYETFITPNDPLYNQWWVAPNSMAEVWDLPAGPYQTTVAVIDTGFALTHQEFAGRFAINSGESGSTSSEAVSDLNCSDQRLAVDKACNNIDDNFDFILDNEVGATTEENPSDLNCSDQRLAVDKACNNLDDDLNGFKDDVSGWDFANYDSNPKAGEISPTGIGTTHGTLVVGVLGATGNNGVGVAGVNWHTKILPIQALDDNSYGDSFTVGQSVYYAVDNGADIISISLGTSFDDPYMRAAILYALDNGVIVVSAAGNNGCNCVSYPANYPEVVAVGAVNPSGGLASFSSYGAQLDILAPGQGISSPTYNSVNQTSAYATNVAGTSFATPFVSGLLAYGKMKQPNASWEEIIGTMFENSDRKTNTLANPRANTLGYGVVRANTMINRLITPQTFVQRLQFDDLNLGSKRNYQCEANQIPATKLYELKKSDQVRYTSNLRELSKAVQTSWASKDIGYTCMGLESDTIKTLRILNLPSEINNTFVKN